jgi:hypothetical protein
MRRTKKDSKKAQEGGPWMNVLSPTVCQLCGGKAVGTGNANTAATFKKSNHMGERPKISGLSRLKEEIRQVCSPEQVLGYGS